MAVPIRLIAAAAAWGATAPGAAAAAAGAAGAAQEEVRSYEISFSGNQTVSGRELRRVAVDEFADFERDGYRDADLDDAAFLMQSHYRRLGFPFAEVAYERHDEGGQAKVRFTVEEGPRTALGEVRVSGAEFFAREQLHAFLVPPNADALSGGPYYVASVVRGAPAEIRAAYYGEGFLEAEVEPPVVQWSEERRRADVLLQVREGRRFLLREVRLPAEPGISRAGLEEAVAELLDGPYFPRRRVEVRTRVVEQYAAQGHPDAAVEVREERAEDGAVTLVVSAEPGPQVRIAEVRVVGNEKTRASFVRSRLLLEEGEVYDRSKEDASFRRLFATGLFARIGFRLEGEGEQRVLVVEVQEAPSQEVTVEPGYGSYERLRLELGWRERNLFGTGRRLRAELEGSQVGWSALVGFTDPWLLGSEVELDVPVYMRRRQEPSFTREDLGVSALLRREFGRHATLAGGLSLRRSDVLSRVADPGPGIPVDEINITSVFVEPGWDSRNDVFNPTRGSQAQLRLEYGGEFLYGELEFARAQLTLSRIWPLSDSEHTLLATGWRTGVIVPVGGTEEIPLQERYFNGGENSVRGFAESELGPQDAEGDPVGGETFQTLNLELRQRLAGNLWGAAFADAGNVGRTTSDWDEDLRAGLGAGLRYLLPVGAVRLDLGWNPDVRPGEDEWQLFLSVGMAF